MLSCLTGEQPSSLAASPATLEDYFRLDIHAIHAKSGLPKFVHHYKDGSKSGLRVQPSDGFKFPTRRIMAGTSML